MDSQHLENMSKNEYMHVPYVVILYKYLVEWKKNHGGKMPQTYKEKREFKEIIKKSMYLFLKLTHVLHLKNSILG